MSLSIGGSVYQYLSWFKPGQTYPNGNKLTSIESINKLKAALLPNRVEVHESIQRYDSLGRVLFTPIYADFDSEDSVDDIFKFIRLCEAEFKLSPDIYFSGNRGYHLFINVPVSHAYPHLVVKKFMAIMSKSKYLDNQMYASRHLLRSEGSIHFKSSLYKTRLSIDELDAGIARGKAKKQLLTQPTHHQSRLLDLFINGLYQVVDKEVQELEEKYAQTRSEMKGEVPNCIQALVKQGPITGQNNNILTLIARSYNQSNVSQDEALDDVAGRPEWIEYRREITSVFRSIYKSPSRFGCRGNTLLTDNCDPFCPFNESTINII
jgi:hypothetical protein